MKEQIRRVFFHELGHYVARTITSKHYDTTGVKAFDIYKSDNEEGEYEGHITPIVPEGMENATGIVIHTPEYMVGLISGCFFEAIVLKQEYWQCFSTNGHGSKDLCARNYVLIKEGLYGDEKRNGELATISYKHFQALQNSTLKEDIEQLDVSSFIGKGAEEKYSIDINALETATKEIIVKYEQLFIDHIEEIRAWLSKVAPKA